MNEAPDLDKTEKRLSRALETFERVKTNSKTRALPSEKDKKRNCKSGV